MTDSLRTDITRGLTSHVEHAKTWPGGWVVWAKPIPYSVQLLLTLGLLDRGDAPDTAIAVHLNDEGKRFLEEWW